MIWNNLEVALLLFFGWLVTMIYANSSFFLYTFIGRGKRGDLQF